MQTTAVAAKTNSDREEGADPGLENKPNTVWVVAPAKQCSSSINTRSFHTSLASSLSPSSSSSHLFSSPHRREQCRQTVLAAGQIHTIKANGRCPGISQISFHEISTRILPQNREFPCIGSLTRAFGSVGWSYNRQCTQLELILDLPTSTGVQEGICTTGQWRQGWDERGPNSTSETSS